MKNRWQKVVMVDASKAWWDRLRASTTFFLRLECGHFVFRTGRKAPKRVRCDGCGP